MVELEFDIISYSKLYRSFLVNCLLDVQPHGFFNCSPAVDVPPSTCELDSKDTDAKETVVTKPIQTPIIAKL